MVLHKQLSHTICLSHTCLVFSNEFWVDRMLQRLRHPADHFQEEVPTIVESIAAQNISLADSEYSTLEKDATCCTSPPKADSTHCRDL
uniref:Uncharacterized protein n=1 Tax=Ditylenchus dipsaci TaxID=166011 RepID=A0A915D0L4_9BILA